VPVSSEPRTDAFPDHGATSTSSFTRTSSTWLAYLLVGYFMYVQASLGPVIPFLREDLSLGYGAAGLHFGAFALGVLFTGLLGDRPARLLGRRKTLWGGAVGMAAGAAGLAAANGIAASLAATLLTGFCASLLLMSAQAALSDLHGEWRAAAISEANVVAGAAAILAPLLVGAFSRTEFPGWRGALLFAAVLLAAISLFLGRAPIPSAKPAADRKEADDGGVGSRVLPAVFWGWCAVIFFCTAVEWSVAYWGSSFLEGEVGLEAADAATLMGAYFVALLLGRVVGSRLARRVRPGVLLVGAVTLSAAGFLPFWLAPQILPPASAATLASVAGLFVAGLGIGNLYPLGASLATGAASHVIDLATSRIALTVGCATLIIPPALGIAADRVGISTAYAIVAALLLAAAILAITVDRKAQKQQKQKGGEFTPHPNS
jgi:fucose permease